MPDLNRRDLVTALAAIATVTPIRADAQAAPEAQPSLVHSQIFPLDQRPVKPSANGGASRAVIHGALPIGEFIEVH